MWDPDNNWQLGLDIPTGFPYTYIHCNATCYMYTSYVLFEVRYVKALLQYCEFAVHGVRDRDLPHHEEHC